jgi:hypothetical protein
MKSKSPMTPVSTHRWVNCAIYCKVSSTFPSKRSVKEQQGLYVEQNDQQHSGCC